MKIKKTILTVFLTILLVVFGLHTALASHGHSEDNVPGHECEQGIHLYNPHCQPTPTLTPTPTGTECEENCVTPEPTKEPEATPVVENQGGPGDGGSDHRSDNLGCSVNNCNTYPNSPVDNTPVGWK